MIRTTLAALAATATLAAPALACPDWEGRPYFGTIELYAGFTPDPYVRNITAGGTQNLDRCGLNAAGYVTVRPDFDLYWNGSSSQITIAVEVNRADAILLINAPDGSWWYNDDYRGTNPAITFYNPQEGLYDIWVGTYDGSRRNPGRLIVTEFTY